MTDSASKSPTTPIFFKAVPEVRSAAHGDGVVLMDLRRDKYLAFNPVGALIWRCLDAGSDRDGILAVLKKNYPAVADERLARDLDHMLGSLRRNGLIEPATGAEMSRRAPASEAATAEDRREAPVPSSAPRVAAPSTAPQRFDVARAWLVLAACDVALKILGFEAFHSRLRNLRPAPRSAAPGDVERLRQAVDLAAGFYFKRAWCLQRSAATVWLMRRAGIEADLVIGVRRLPFLAHAWVEVDGRVVNDRPTVRTFYQCIERC